MYTKRVIKSNCLLDLENIELYKESTGYSFYLPLNFFEDLVHFLVHKQLKHKNIFLFEDDITLFLSKIPDVIIDAFVKENNIICKALYILKYIAASTNLCSLENNSIKEVIDDKENYKDGLTFKLNIPATDAIQNTHVLNILHELLSFDVEINKVKNSTLGYKKIMSLKKSYLARPDFGYKLTKKTGTIKQDKDIVNKPLIIFIEDVSSSMAFGHSKEIADTIKFYLTNLDVDVYHLVKGNYKFLTTHEEKIKQFKDTTYFKTRYDYKDILLGLSKDFNGKKIIILNDGEDDMPKDLMVNNQLFVLNTGIINKNASILCKLNKGQEIKL